MAGMREKNGAVNGSRSEKEKQKKKFIELVESLYEVTAGFDIVRMRKLLGMTQEQFARTLGVTISTERRWEHKKTKIPIDVLPKAGGLAKDYRAEEEERK